MGDRHQQNGINYTLDLNAGLTQVLADQTNTYLYGNGRVAQVGSTTEYFLGDALGSVRQLTDPASAVTLTQSYAPYGEVTQSVGASQTSYGFTGENRDANGLTYLRARYLDSSTGRFTQKDPSGLEENLYLYAKANPLRYTDPTGLISKDEAENADMLVRALATYNILFDDDWGELPYSSVNKISFIQQSCGWYDGEWKMSEILETYLAVTDLAAAMGGRDKFMKNIDRIFISKAPTGYAASYRSPSNIIFVTNRHNDLKRWTMVHELAHAWDYKHGKKLSKDMEEFTGGHTGPFYSKSGYCKSQPSRAPGCNDANYFYGGVPAYVSSDDHFNRKEDFTYSVAAYIYPDETYKIWDIAMYKNSRNKKHLYYPDFRYTPRWLYIYALMNWSQ